MYLKDLANRLVMYKNVLGKYKRNEVLRSIEPNILEVFVQYFTSKYRA